MGICYTIPQGRTSSDPSWQSVVPINIHGNLLYHTAGPDLVRSVLAVNGTYFMGICYTIPQGRTSSDPSWQSVVPINIHGNLLYHTAGPDLVRSVLAVSGTITLLLPWDTAAIVATEFILRTAVRKSYKQDIEWSSSQLS